MAALRSIAQMQRRPHPLKVSQLYGNVLRQESSVLAAAKLWLLAGYPGNT